MSTRRCTRQEGPHGPASVGAVPLRRDPLGRSRVQYFDVEPKKNSSADYVRVYRGQTSGKSTALESFDLPNIAAQCVRVVGRGNSVNDQVGFTEVRVKGY